MAEIKNSDLMVLVCVYVCLCNSGAAQQIRASHLRQPERKPQTGTEHGFAKKPVVADHKLEPTLSLCVCVCVCVSDPGCVRVVGGLCVGSLQGDGGLTGGEGAHVIGDGSAGHGDAASRIPGGQVRDRHTHIKKKPCIHTLYMDAYTLLRKIKGKCKLISITIIN